MAAGGHAELPEITDTICQIAKAARPQLKADGLRSFGAKKEKDHYSHHGVE